MSTYKNEILCPVCNTNINSNNIIGCSYEQYIECYSVCEEYKHCSCCGYYYGFAYGNYTEIVNNKEFVWTYKCYKNKKTYAKFNKLIEKNMKRHQRKWKLFKTNYYQKEPYFTYYCANNENEKIERIRGGV